MKNQLTARLNVVTRLIEDIEEMLEDTYHYCSDEHDHDILNDELDEYLDERDEIEAELEYWS